MKLWLKKLYDAAYLEYQNLRSTYDEHDGGFDSFEEWCKHFAAKAVVCWIRTDVGTQELTQYLQRSSTQQATGSGSWWPFSSTGG